MSDRTRPARPPRAAPHPFAPDADLPADHAGRQVCATCHKTGKPGDAQHPDQAVTVPALPDRIAGPATARDAAILGESRDEEYR